MTYFRDCPRCGKHHVFNYESAELITTPNSATRAYAQLSARGIKDIDVELT